MRAARSPSARWRRDLVAGLEGRSHLTRERRPLIRLDEWAKRRKGVQLGGERTKPSAATPINQLHGSPDPALEAVLWAERNRWSIRRHCEGKALPPRLRKRDAERALRAALRAAFSEGEVA